MSKYYSLPKKPKPEEPPNPIEELLGPDWLEQVKGEKGDKGDTGDPALFRGEKGERGDKGDKGDPGKDGLDGKDGRDGQDGAPGKDGKAGRVGPRGEKGERGAKGDRGERGPVGPPGLAFTKEPGPIMGPGRIPAGAPSMRVIDSGREVAVKALEFIGATLSLQGRKAQIEIPAGGESVPFNIEVDEDPLLSVTYVGEADPGSLPGAAVWRIKKLTETGVDISNKWADGTATFTKVWDDRTTYTYS